MTSVSKRVLTAIKELPDITGPDIVELMPDVPKGSVAAALTHLYESRKVLRTSTRTSNNRPTFKYQIVPPGATAPEPKVKRYARRSRVSAKPAHTPVLREKTDFVAGASKASMRGRIRQLEDEVASLRTWKTEALLRYPDLAVEQVVLLARKLVASILKDSGDTSGAQDVLSGKRDGCVAMRATVEAFNRGG